jgi:hypothetical protein
MKRILMAAVWLLLSSLMVLPTAKAKMVRIGESQIVSHPALDNDAKGFKAALAEEGFIEGQNVVYDRQNAQGEQPNCAIIARKFEDDKVDLIHAISTPVAQAQVKISPTIPIVFSSVTDPVATGIIPHEGDTGIHVTGVSIRSVPRMTLSAVAGSVIYKFIIAVGLRLGLAPTDLKLATGIMVILAGPRHPGAQAQERGQAASAGRLAPST